MARKISTVQIEAPGRDFGKVFKLVEMPAAQAENWAIRVFLAMAKSGVEVPEDIASSGMVGIATLGLKALSGISWENAEPLLAEMFQCVSIIPDPSKPSVVRALIADDIEEVATRLKLRKDILALHTDFFTSAVGSMSNST